MEASLKTVFTLAAMPRQRPSSRRRTPAADLACESLEGRQLLSLAPGSSPMYLAHAGRHVMMQRGSFGSHELGRAMMLQGHTQALGTTVASTGSAAGGVAVLNGSAGTGTVTASAQTQTVVSATTPSTTSTTGTSTTSTNAAATPASGTVMIKDGAQDSAGGLLLNGLIGDPGVGARAFISPIGAGSLFGSPVLKAQASTTTSSSTPSSSASTLKTDFEKLHTDLQAINDKSQVTPALLAAVRKDFQTIQSDATTKPDQTKLNTLSTDVSNLKGTLPTSAQVTQLENDFTAVLNSEGVTDQTLISKAISDIQAVVQATNVTQDDLTTLAADQQAIQNDTPAPPSGGTSSGNTAATDPVDIGFPGSGKMPFGVANAMQFKTFAAGSSTNGPGGGPDFVYSQGGNTNGPVGGGPGILSYQNGGPKMLSGSPLIVDSQGGTAVGPAASIALNSSDFQVDGMNGPGSIGAIGGPNFVDSQSGAVNGSGSGGTSSVATGSTTTATSTTNGNAPAAPFFWRSMGGRAGF